MNQQVIAGGLLLAFAAWTLWPQIRAVLKKVGGSLPDIIPDPNPAEEAARQDVEDFRAFRTLVARASRCGNPEANKFLQAAITPLFGGPTRDDL